jgi:hypothetical protein
MSEHCLPGSLNAIIEEILLLNLSLLLDGSLIQNNFLFDLLPEILPITSSFEFKPWAFF